MMRNRMTTWMVLTAMLALTGCMFGDEPKQPELGPWHWADDNCVPVECLAECCQGWNYSAEPGRHGGNVSGDECEKVRQKTPQYNEYVYLMSLQQNWCSDDYKYWESGYCEVVNPPDVIKKFGPDGQPVYAGLSFPVCPPRGQTAGHPVGGVELAPEK